MPGKTGPIERRLRAVYSQVASSIVTRALRPSRAAGSWSIRWWVTATCPLPGGPVVATRQGGGGPKGAPQPLMWQRLVVAPPGTLGRRRLPVRVSTRRLVPLGHGFATIWPVGRCCPAVPEQFSAPGLRRRACAAIVAVCPCLWSSCVLDAGRSARTKLWRVLEGPQSWPPRAPRRSPQ